MAVLITLISVLVAAVALVASIAGRQSDLAAVLTDEVARRQALEHEAQRERARLQAIFDAAVDAIITIDRNGRIAAMEFGRRSAFSATPPMRFSVAS